MRRRIQSGVSAFNEVFTKLNTGTIILRVTEFASIIIVGFDSTTTKIDDIVVGVIHDGFFTKATLWLKTRSDHNG
jgi:hypothetical protein